MKKTTFTLLALLAVCGACKDEEFVNRQPTNILLTTTAGNVADGPTGASLPVAMRGAAVSAVIRLPPVRFRRALGGRMGLW